MEIYQRPFEKQLFNEKYKLVRTRALHMVNLLTLLPVHSCAVPLKANSPVSTEAVETNREKSHISI